MRNLIIVLFFGYFFIGCVSQHSYVDYYVRNHYSFKDTIPKESGAVLAVFRGTKFFPNSNYRMEVKSKAGESFKIYSTMTGSHGSAYLIGALPPGEYKIVNLFSADAASYGRWSTTYPADRLGGFEVKLNQVTHLGSIEIETFQNKRFHIRVTECHLDTHCSNMSKENKVITSLFPDFLEHQDKSATYLSWSYLNLANRDDFIDTQAKAPIHTLIETSKGEYWAGERGLIVKSGSGERHRIHTYASVISASFDSQGKLILGGEHNLLYRELGDGDFEYLSNNLPLGKILDIQIQDKNIALVHLRKGAMTFWLCDLGDLTHCSQKAELEMNTSAGLMEDGSDTYELFNQYRFYDKAEKKIYVAKGDGFTIFHKDTFEFQKIETPFDVKEVDLLPNNLLVALQATMMDGTSLRVSSDMGKSWQLKTKEDFEVTPVLGKDDFYYAYKKEGWADTHGNHLYKSKDMKLWLKLESPEMLDCALFSEEDKHKIFKLKLNYSDYFPKECK